MPKFIIETIEKPTRYWSEIEGLGCWVGRRRLATEFSEAEREQVLQNLLKGAVSFPAGGCWIQIDEPDETTLRRAMKDTEHLDAAITGMVDVGLGAGRAAIEHLTRHRFTVIKLRPVAIRLSASLSDDNYDDLNQQALEFEAAIRQFVMKQQVLCAPEWQVDIETEEE